MSDILYAEGTNRESIAEAITKALGMAIEANAPYFCNGVDTDGNKTYTRVPVNYAYDEANFTEYTTPSIMVFNPGFEEVRELRTNQPVYRDFDYDKLTAKQFTEPTPGNFKFKIHAATRNPTTDNRLLEYLIQFSKDISFIDAEIFRDLKQYDRFEVVWYEPTEFESTDISKIREITCSVFAWVENLNYREVRLLEPGNAVDLIYENYESTKYYLWSKTALELYKGDVEVQVISSLVGFPTSGSVQIEDDIVTYTSRTKYKLLGVSGITRFHNFDTRVEYLS